MKHCKTIILAFVALVAWLPLGASGADASALLSSLRSRMAAPSVEALFTIDGPDGAVQGSAIMSGMKIAMTTPQMCVWYDGTTQWTYLASSRELNISQPDATELIAGNPFAILTADAAAYKARKLSESKGKARIELLPADTASGIGSINITMNTATRWPETISVTMTDGRTISARIDKISAGKAMPISTFRYNKALYPASEVIDLR